MALLGFNAIGRLAIGQIGQNFAYSLPAVAGSFTVTSYAATFAVNFATVGSTYTLAGSAATFNPKLVGAAGSLLVTGSAASVATKMALSGTTYAITGGAATFYPALLGAAASFVLTGFAVNEIILGAARAGSYTVTGNAAALTRDYINWLPHDVRLGLWSRSEPPTGTRLMPDDGKFHDWGPGLLGVGGRRGPSIGGNWTAQPAPSQLWTNNPAQFIPTPVAE